MKRFLTPFTVILLALASSFAHAQSIGSSAGNLTVSPIVTGLNEPWAFGFLPDGGILITERDGRLLLAKNSRLDVIRGTPRVVRGGQGGLLDVMVPRDFASSREIFLTFSERTRAGAVTSVARGMLREGATRLENVEIILTMNNAGQGGRHFGSRLVEGNDGTLFVTVGDRADPDTAQDLGTHNGSVVRINRDGSVPANNPFLGVTGARPEIWSFGHRNAQGAALDSSGQLWIVEHGARGGDEINRISRGANYGWPVIAYGTHYSGAKIGEGTSKPGMEQPDFYWDPSIAPSGMMIYSGRLWPQWRGDIFVGSLKFDMISRVTTSGTLVEAERLKSRETGRVRDIREGPDGTIWYLSVESGALYQIRPQR